MINSRSRTRRNFILLATFLLIISLISGCSLDLSGPTYTHDSIPAALHEYNIEAHYPADQGSGKLLTQATGTRYLLQIDSIDNYKLYNGWVEVYLYQDPAQAYADAMAARKAYDERCYYDEKVAELQGKTLEKAPYPLFQHGNVIVFGEGIANDPQALQSLTQIFGQFNE